MAERYLEKHWKDAGGEVPVRELEQLARRGKGEEAGNLGEGMFEAASASGELSSVVVSMT